jgi:hypothetical protein
MPRRSLEARIAALREQEEQLKARRLQIQAHVRDRERRSRTRRLIQVGGVAAAFGIESPELLERLLGGLVASPEARRRLATLGAVRTERWPADPDSDAAQSARA